MHGVNVDMDKTKQEKEHVLTGILEEVNQFVWVPHFRLSNAVKNISFMNIYFILSRMW